MQRHLLGFLLSCSPLSAACAPQASPLLVGDQSDAGDDSPSEGDGDEAACDEGSDEKCTCAETGTPGTRSCRDGEFGACEQCESLPEDKVLRCVAGRYKGEGHGNARSTAGGIPGVWTPFNDDKNMALWAFDLMRSNSEEFYTVGNACMHVTNLMGVDDGGARAFLSGEVNCRSGVLEAEIRGFYTAMGLFGGPMKYFYRGRLRGTFDPETNSFVDTRYVYREPAVAVDPQPGGDGVWTATLVDEEAPVGETTVEECLGDFPDDDTFPEVEL